MKPIYLRLLLSGTMLIAAASCTPPDNGKEVCATSGGRYELRKEQSDLVVGYCVFPDNSECQVHQFRTGQCKPGQNFNNAPAVTVSPNPTYPPVNHDLIFFTQPITATTALEPISSIKGVLGLQGRCLRVLNTSQQAILYSLVWPANFRYQWDSQDVVEVVHAQGQVVARLGQMLLINGQESLHAPASAEAEAICPGPYWFVGDQISPSN